MSNKWIILIVGLSTAVVLGGVGATAFWQYHEQPQFCVTCHIMDPYLETWRSTDYLAGVHAESGVECLDCHHSSLRQEEHEVADYVEGNFRVPLRERDYGNEFCFDCHLPNEHTTYTQVISLTQDYTMNNRNINPHDPHAGTQGPQEHFECLSCHKMHEESPLINFCYSCHHTETFETCSDCHE